MATMMADANSTGASGTDAADRSRLRVSDAEREKAAGDLGNALAEGRLSADEHSERLDGVYAAKTYGDLQRILDDLPAGNPALLVREPATVVSASSRSRDGRWRLRPVELAVTVNRPVSEARAMIIDRVGPRLRGCGLAQYPTASAVQYRPRFIGLVLLWLARRLSGEQVTFTFEPRGPVTEVRATGRVRGRAHAELTAMLRGS